MAYKKCPRCELNYIKDTEQYCKVCLVDMGKLAGDHILDDDILDEDLRLCPECGENYLEEGEEMCYACGIEQMKQLSAKDALSSLEDGMEFEEEFVPVVKDEPEEVLIDSLEMMDDAESDEEAEEE